MLIPVNAHIAWTFILVGVIGILVLEYRGWKNKKNKDPIPSDKGQLSEYMPLSEASLEVYDRLKKGNPNHPYVMIVEMSDSNPDMAYDFFTEIIKNHTDVFGKKVPSNSLEKLDIAEIGKDGNFCDRGDSFKFRESQKANYVDIVVKRKSISKIIETLLQLKEKSEYICP